MTTPSPDHPQDRLETLICAVEGFPALERLVLGARDRVCLAFRILDTTTRLRSPEARSLGLEDWADLLAYSAAHGVRVRLLLSDFDAIMANDLHRGTWESARYLSARAPPVEILCAPHPARVGEGLTRLLTPLLRRRFRRQREKGLDTPPLRAAVEHGNWRPCAVTLHQKFAVADGARAILGGLDVDERRWDDTAHHRPSAQTWHDVSLSVEGPSCRAIEHHFAACWALAMRDGDNPARAPVSAFDAPLPEPQDHMLLRTQSRRQDGAFAFGPEVDITEIETAHHQAIGAARDSIYLETQYFRHVPLANTLARRARENPRLNFILLVPSEPEELAFNGDRSPPTRHAQALQMRCLEICRRAFGARMTVVSPAKPQRAKDRDGKPLAGAGIVYVHSKVTIVDDDLAIVGSANFNGRSMRWDTEAALRVTDRTFVADLRARLARVWMGPDAAEIDRAGVWQARAESNSRRKPEEREGFVLPYPERRNRRLSFYVPVFPDDMF